MARPTTDRLVRWTVRWLQRKHGTQLRDDAAAAAQEFREAGGVLWGATRPVSGREARAVWIGCYVWNVQERVMSLLAKALTVAVLGSLVVDVGLDALRDFTTVAPARLKWPELGGDLLDAITAGARGLFPMPHPVNMLQFAVLPLLILLVRNGYPYMAYSGRRRVQWRKLNQVPYVCSILVRRCAELARQAPHQSRPCLRNLDDAVTLVIREVTAIASDPLILPRYSQRRKEVKRHTALVASALRKASLRLDAEPVAAATDLADMAIRISDAYVGHRRAQLLEESELAGLDPLRNRESLRVSAAGVITLGVAYLAAIAGLPGPVLPLVFGFAGLIAFHAIVGRGPTVSSFSTRSAGSNGPRPRSFLRNRAISHDF
ncbi:hypothetical protein [Streptomyces sp. NPDC004685]